MTPSGLGDPPPAWMPPEAKALWFRCATALFARGVLKPTDELFLGIFCATYARMQSARRSMSGGVTKQERAGAEKFVFDFATYLNDMLCQMGFHSESDFEQFLSKSIH
jgi:phage terminase small subunit